MTEQVSVVQTAQAASGDALTEQEALALARNLVETDCVSISIHCRDRQGERGVHASDIRAAILSATVAHFDPAKDTWRCRGGCGYEGDRIDIVIAFKDGNSRAIIVTTFRI